MRSPVFYAPSFDLSVLFVVTATNEYRDLFTCSACRFDSSASFPEAGQRFEQHVVITALYVDHIIQTPLPSDTECALASVRSVEGNGVDIEL
jgi:hypothetical protein